MLCIYIYAEILASLLRVVVVVHKSDFRQRTTQFINEFDTSQAAQAKKTVGKYSLYKSQNTLHIYKSSVLLYEVEEKNNTQSRLNKPCAEYLVECMKKERLLYRILNSTTPNICVAMLNYLNTTYLHILSKNK